VAEVVLNLANGDLRMLRHEMREHIGPAQRERLNTAFWQHLFAPIRQVVQRGLDEGELAGGSAAELTMLFLGLMEAFHGFSHAAPTPPLPRAIQTVSKARAGAAARGGGRTRRAGAAAPR